MPPRGILRPAAAFFIIKGIFKKRGIAFFCKVCYNKISYLRIPSHGRQKLGDCMADINKIKRIIDPHKVPDKQFFLDLLDADKQTACENEHIDAVMTMLRII